MGVQVTRRRTLDLDYRCESCGYQCLAVLNARGAGRSRSGAFVGDDDEGLARGDAEHELLNDAQSQLGLLPCPRCKKRNRGEVVIFRVKAVFRLLGNAGFGAVAYMITTLGGWSSTATWAIMTLVGGVTIANVVDLYRRWFRADKRLVLLPKAKPTRPAGAD